MRTEDQKAREYLDGLRQQVEGMTEYEQAINKTVLILGQVMCEILTRHDQEVFNTLKVMVDDLFMQADAIMKQGPKHLQ